MALEAWETATCEGGRLGALLWESLQAAEKLHGRGKASEWAQGVESREDGGSLDGRQAAVGTWAGLGWVGGGDWAPALQALLLLRCPAVTSCPMGPPQPPGCLQPVMGA